MNNNYFETIKRITSCIMILTVIIIVFSAVSLPSFAEGELGSQTDAESVVIPDDTSAKAISSGIAVGIACVAGALGMAFAIGKSVESMARQPEASDKINSALMLGLVFIETTIIYALIVAILIVFVL